MKKRVLAALLTGAMLVSMLAGCGDDTAGGESGTASAGAGTTEQTAGSAEGDGEMYRELWIRWEKVSQREAL